MRADLHRIPDSFRFMLYRVIRPSHSEKFQFRMGIDNASSTRSQKFRKSNHFSCILLPFKRKLRLLVWFHLNRDKHCSTFASAMMTREEIQLVKKSWRIFQRIDPTLVGDVFYSNLFAAQPRLRNMFPNDMQQQYQKLVDMISFMVQQLDQPERLAGEIKAMAERHIGYGVKPQQYETVGKTLLLTLRQGLGNDWNPALEKAWIKCYSLISTIMTTAKRVNL